jgi:GR25 family glycosyltransferase involved in LPS biosynthesis
MIIEKIFIINYNLKNNKLNYFDKLINKLKIEKNNIEIFTSVNSDDIYDDKINNFLSITSQNTLLLNKVNSYKDISDKQDIANYLTHYKIWEKIITNNLNNVLIISDDMLLNINESEFIKYINSIPEDYDIGILSWNNYWFDHLKNPKKKVIVNDYWYIYDSINIFNLNSYLINKKGAEKLIINAFPICYKIDSYINILNKIDTTFKRYISNQSLFKKNKKCNIKCKECDITERINLMYNKKYNIETFGNINSNNNIIIIITIILIFLIIKMYYNKD